MNLSPDDFKDIRITPDGMFSVYDAIAKFKECTAKKSLDIYSRFDEVPKLRLHQFLRTDGRKGRGTPVA